MLKPPTFAVRMVRPLLSYVLATVILLSQTGLPVHMHYCKGMLESVSVFFSQGCDDHQEVTSRPASCCKKEESSSCDKANSDCCDDKVNYLIQGITSLVPHFDKWDNVVPVTSLSYSPIIALEEKVASVTIPGIQTNSGPPRYILHQALIFYA
jgi:hypothetical protein